MKRFFVTIAALLFSFSAFAALTAEQKAVILADIQASPDALAAYQLGDTATLAIIYNAKAAPDFVVWRTSVTQDEIMMNGFDWVQVDNLTVGKARIWEWLFDNSQTTINPSKVNVRAGIDEAWKGTAAMLAVRASIYTHIKRFATKLEKLFATGLGTDANPATMTFEGEISPNDFAGL